MEDEVKGVIKARLKNARHNSIAKNALFVKLGLEMGIDVKSAIGQKPGGGKSQAVADKKKDVTEKQKGVKVKKSVVEKQKVVVERRKETQ